MRNNLSVTWNLFLKLWGKNQSHKNSILVNSNHANKAFNFNIIIKNLSLRSQKMNKFLIRLVQSNRKDPHFWMFKLGSKLLRAAPQIHAEYQASQHPRDPWGCTLMSELSVPGREKKVNVGNRSKLQRFPLSLPLTKGWTITPKSSF